MLSPSINARTMEEIHKSGKILVSTNGTFSPFSFYQGGTLTGFEVDLAQELAKKLKLKLEWKIVPFDSSLIGLGQDRYDFVIVSHGITEERKKIVDFSDPYYCTGAVIIAREGGPQKIGEIQGKVVGTQVGTTYYSYLKKLVNPTDIRTFKSETDTFLALKSGKIEATIGDKFGALAAQKSRPDAKLQIGEMLFNERIAMAVKKGNSDLQKAINGALAELLKDGTYKRISEKYFDQDIRCI